MARLINDIDIPYGFGNLRLSINESEFLARQINNNGYRKESDVTKENEELKKLNEVLKNDNIAILDKFNQIKDILKSDIAKEILLKIKARAESNYGSMHESIVCESVYEWLAKEYGVEL